jgi:hypothetical protein
LSVIEPYKGGRRLLSIQRVEVRTAGNNEPSDQAAAIRIQRQDGRIDYFVHSVDPLTEFRIGEQFSFQGTVGLYSEIDGKPVYAFVANGTRIGRTSQPVIDEAKSSFSGTVRDFTRELVDENWIRVHLDVDVHAADCAALVGKHIAVEGPGRNPVFRITDCALSGANEFILHIGHVTLIQDWADSSPTSTEADGPSSVYRYAIEEGDRFTISLTAEWVR